MEKRRKRIILLLYSISLFFPLLLSASQDSLLIDSLLIASKVHIEKGRNEHAIYTLLNVSEMAKEIHDLGRLQKSIRLLIEVHENLGDYKTANIYMKELQRVLDSIYLQELEQAIYLNPDSSLSLTHKEYIGKLETSKRRQFNLFFIIIIVIMVAATLVIIINFRHTKKKMQAIIDNKTNDLKKANIRLENEIVEKTESEEKFRTIFENAPVMIDAFNDEGKCLLWNQECERQLGWTEKEMTESDDPLCKLYLEKSDKNTLLNRIRKADGTFHENCVIAKDGTSKIQCWANYRLSPGFYLCVGYDVTERKKNEEALKDSRERYKQLVDNSPSLILEVNPETSKIINCNPAMAKALGSSNIDLLGKNIRDYLPDDIFQSRYNICMKALKGNKVQVAEDYNKGHYYYNTYIPVVSGDKTTLQIVSYDITERKKVEMELTERKALLQSLIYNIPLDFYARDKEGKVFMQSARSIQKWGDQFGLGIDDIQVKDSLKDMWKKWNESALSGKEVEGEYKVFINGKQHHMKTVITSIREDDEIIGLLGVDIDITEEKESERKLIELKDNLENMVEEEIQKRKIQQELLIQKSKLESLGQLAAGIAHEINQPIGLISLGLDNVLERLKNDDNISVIYLREKINNFFKYIERVRQIIDHIGTFSRDQKDIIFDELNINSVIEQALNMIKQQYKNSNITFNINLEKNIPSILGNSFKIEQVFLNLLSNSYDALEARSQRKEGFQKIIAIKTFKKRKDVVVEFTDNGIGIPNKDLDNIFDPFFTTKGPDRGTGLGLSVSYGILEEMNASIVAKSIPNEFTSFTIKFRAMQEYLM